MSKYLCLFSGEHKSLAKEELFSVLKKYRIDFSVFSDFKKGLVFESSKNPFFDHLAFTKYAFEILFFGSKKIVLDWLKKSSYSSNKTVKFEKFSLDDSSEKVSKDEFYSLFFNWLSSPKINLTNPDEIFSLVVSKDRFFVCKTVFSNKEKFFLRKNHNRPCPHPTSLSPKLARCLINLSSAKKIVLDPFCGSGGILLEAAFMNFDVEGFDLDPIMIKRCVKNFDYFNKKGKFICGDALELLNNSDSVDAIISDLPYGKNSKVDNITSLYSSFLDISFKKTDSLVVCFPSFVDSNSFIEKSKWNIYSYFEWSLNRSLKKLIYVLKK